MLTSTLSVIAATGQNLQSGWNIYAIQKDLVKVLLLWMATRWTDVCCSKVKSVLWSTKDQHDAVLSKVSSLVVAKVRNHPNLPVPQLSHPMLDVSNVGALPDNECTTRKWKSLWGKSTLELAIHMCSFCMHWQSLHMDDPLLKYLVSSHRTC